MVIKARNMIQSRQLLVRKPELEFTAIVSTRLPRHTLALLLPSAGSLPWLLIGYLG